MAQFRNFSRGARGVYDADGKLHMVEAGQLTPDVKLAKGEPNEEWFGDPDETLADRGKEIASRLSEDDLAEIESRFNDLRSNFDAQLSEANDRTTAVEAERDTLAKEVEDLKSKVAELEAAAAGTTGEGEEPGPLDGSVEDLTVHIEGIEDPDAIQRLLDAETAGKSRKGAISALEARRDELLAS